MKWAPSHVRTCVFLNVDTMKPQRQHNSHMRRTKDAKLHAKWSRKLSLHSIIWPVELCTLLYLLLPPHLPFPIYSQAVTRHYPQEPPVPSESYLISHRFLSSSPACVNCLLLLLTVLMFLSRSILQMLYLSLFDNMLLVMMLIKCVYHVMFCICFLCLSSSRQQSQYLQ